LKIAQSNEKNNSEGVQYESGEKKINTITKQKKMKKILLLSAALLLTTTIGFTQEKISQQKTDVEAARLKGQVKSVRTITCDAKKKIKKGKVLFSELKFPTPKSSL
jgi:hypothetical protein